MNAFAGALKKPEVALAYLFNSASAASAQKPAADETGNKSSTAADGDSTKLSLAGSVTVNIVNNKVRANIGTDGSDTRATVLQTPGSIDVEATLTEKAAAASTASASQDENDLVVAVALAVNVYDNEADATIGGNTVADAGLALTDNAAVTYPFLFDFKTATLESAFARDPLGTAQMFLDGTLGVSSLALNDWVLTQATSKASGSISVSGSVGVNLYNDIAHATVATGAQINQTAAFQTPAQNVAITASTTIDIADLAGIGKFSLNDGGIYGVATSTDLKTPKAKLSNAILGNGLIDLYGQAGASAIGGSLMATSIVDDTRALVEPGAAVHAGANTGLLTVAATESIIRAEVAQSGAATGSSGKLAFAGSGVGYRQRSTTVARIASDASSGAAVSGDQVAVTATTGGVQVGVAGALISGQGGTTGIGVSAVVNDIARTTAATIGADPVVAPNVTPAGLTTLTADTLTLNADTTGVIVALAVAGVKNTASTTTAPAQPDQSASPDDALDGVSLPTLFSEDSTPPTTSQTTSGVGIAGSALVNLIADTTLATIDTAGTIAAGSVAQDARNDQVEALVSGAVAVAVKGKSSGASGSATIAGAFAVNQLTDDTEAFLRGATLSGTGSAQSRSRPMASAWAPQ